MVKSPYDHNGECIYCDELGEHAPDCEWLKILEGAAGFTFNKAQKIAVRKPFSEPEKVDIDQILEAKEEKRTEGRCEKCGSIKEKQSDGFIRCMVCKRRRRNTLRQEKRNEAKPNQS
jgi:hypothetical protein